MNLGLPRLGNLSARARVSGSLALVILSALIAATACPAQDWPNWRGPHHNGWTQAADLPTDFTREKQVRWSTKLPGPGACTPIVIGDDIFLTSVDSKRERLVALCIGRTDGKLRWQKDAGSGYTPKVSIGQPSRVAGRRRSNYASPSPATDGKRVVFFFGNGDLVAYDLAGAELWRRNVQKDYGEFAFQWTFSASPTLCGGKLFLPILQRDTPAGRGFGRRGGGRRRGGDQGQREKPQQGERQVEEQKKIESFVLVLDPKTGKTLHKVVRPSPALFESLESYTTMIPWVDASGRKQLLLAGGDVLTGHDPANGAELWRWGTWNAAHRQRMWRLVPTVVVGDGVGLVCAPKRAPVFAIKLGGKAESDEERLIWQSEGRPNPVSSDVPTPAYWNGHFYVLSDVRSALSKVAAKDGKVAWTRPLSRDYLWRASPTVADNKVFCMSHNGEVVVVDAEKGKILHHAFMGEEEDDLIRSTVVVAHGNLFIRTNSTLFCLGKP